MSMKSDWSMAHPPEMKGGDRSQSLRCTFAYGVTMTSHGLLMVS